MDTRSTYPFSANHSEDLSLNPFDFFGAHSCKSFSFDSKTSHAISIAECTSRLGTLWGTYDWIQRGKIPGGWFSEIQILILYCQILYTILQYWKYISGGSLFLSWGVPNGTPIQTPFHRACAKADDSHIFCRKVDKKREKARSSWILHGHQGTLRLVRNIHVSFFWLLTQMEPVIL